MTRDKNNPETGQDNEPGAAGRLATKTDRADRLAAALRENLKKRKAQARQRKQADSTSSDEKAD